ncbi:hypothetical protein [Halobellus salinisoli]|uniref:hypothetical protein n=1 Tax=Halobellus salinisoli TaxID=3108500 RepID=UPI00300BC850
MKEMRYGLDGFEPGTRRSLAPLGAALVGLQTHGLTAFGLDSLFTRFVKLRSFMHSVGVPRASATSEGDYAEDTSD